jgi:lactate dehydrogenase-like 2-hydroxyacid dehydrogenase
LHAAVAGADAVVTLLHDRVDEPFLEAAGPQLRLVANVAVGYDNVDVASCGRRGILVTNTPGVLTEATADLALALILMVTRRLGEGERLLRAGRPWSWAIFFLLGSGIQGKTLGIVGLGQIGRATARRARAFGMTTVYCGRRADQTTDAQLGAAHLSLEELLATAYVTAETRHLIDTAALERMKPTAFLVNTARGPIVDEQALVDALRNGTIAGAALDVYEHEPSVHPGLLELEQAVLIPHLGSATLETRTAMAVLAARNTLAVVRGQQPPTPVGNTPQRDSGASEARALRSARGQH